jgi:hypothetical protein
LARINSKQVDNKALLHGLIASVVALGAAGGRDNLHRAGDLLRDMASNPGVDSETAAVIGDILVAVDGVGR